MIDGLIQTKRQDLIKHVDKIFAFIDFEFTCEDSNIGKKAGKSNREMLSKRELLSVGLLLCRLVKDKDNYLRLIPVDEYESVMCPVVDPNLSEFCTELTGITTEQAIQATATDIVLARAKTKLERNNVIRLINWGKVDKHILGNSLYHLYSHSKDTTGAVYIHQYIYNIEKEILRMYDVNSENTSLGLRKLFKLSRCSFKYGDMVINSENIDDTKTHSALFDCMITAYVTEKYLNDLKTFRKAVKTCVNDVQTQRRALFRNKKVSN